MRDEALDVSLPDVFGECPRCVVRALDQRRLEQVADGEPLARAQRDARLADCGRLRRDRDHVVETRMLERDEHGHHLRQARDRHAARRALRQEHVAGPAVLHDVRARVHVGSRSEGRGDERERGRYGEQPKLQRAKATGGSERTANDEHGCRHEQEEGDRKGVPPRLRAPVEVPHQPEAVQTSLFSRAASCAAAERQSSSVALNA